MPRIADNTLPKDVGEFSWQTEFYPSHLAMMLPCGHVHSVPVQGNWKWTWDGNEDAPTLTPSLRCTRDQSEMWHGHLTTGVMRSC